MSDWAVWAAFILGTPAGIAALALLASRSIKALRAFEQTNRADRLAVFDDPAGRAIAVVPHK